MDISDYQHGSDDYHRLLGELMRQIEHLITQAGVALGVPIEGRVKDIASILDKKRRKAGAVSSVRDIDDLIGLRVIVLFQRDLTVVDKLLRGKFEVVEVADTSLRLDSSQFGYQSLHYILRIKSEWTEIPSFAGLAEYVFEVQLRTLAQHIWAVASHKLQYKREESVPPPLKRSISRVSALLEIVDLEFERVLEGRDEYASIVSKKDAALNVDLLEMTLNKLLPPQNKDEGHEVYDDLLGELKHFGIDTISKLEDLIEETRVPVQREERRRSSEDPRESIYNQSNAGLDRLISRYERGVFFTHSGLLRGALDEKFGLKNRLAIGKD